MGCATCARREERPLTPRVRTWQVRRHRPSVLHPHSVAPQHLVLLPHLAAPLRLGLHRQHRRLAHPPNSAEHQLSVRARFSARYSSPRAHDSACPFVHRWQRCFRRRPRRWCFCRPFRWWRWVCELRSSSGKRWIWGFGAGRRFCTCAVVWGASLRPVNGQWSSAGVLPQQHVAAGPTSGFPASAPWCTADGSIPSVNNIKGYTVAREAEGEQGRSRRWP